jgi:hypothetical protein
LPLLRSVFITVVEGRLPQQGGNQALEISKRRLPPIGVDPVRQIDVDRAQQRGGLSNLTVRRFRQSAAKRAHADKGHGRMAGIRLAVVEEKRHLAIVEVDAAHQEIEGVVRQDCASLRQRRHISHGIGRFQRHFLRDEGLVQDRAQDSLLRHVATPHADDLAAAFAPIT